MRRGSRMTTRPNVVGTPLGSSGKERGGMETAGETSVTKQGEYPWYAR